MTAALETPPLETEPPEPPVEPDTPEAPPGDADPPEPPEPPPGPPAPPVTATAPTTEKEMEKALKKLDAEAARHTAAVSTIMGEDALELVVCELCEPNIPGFHWPAVAEGDPRQALLDLIAGGGEPNYDKATDARICEKCHGLGRVLTGSLVPEHRTKMCADCTGTGYVIVRGPGTPTPGGELLSAPSPVPDAPAEPAPELDPFGRPRGHEFYGRMPNFMSPEEKARDLPPLRA